jgi:UPF0716 protein FxsA
LRFPILPLLLLWPFAEIAGFVMVGREIGVLPTLGLIFFSSFVGFVLLRIQGLGILNRIRSEMDRGNVPGRELIHGLMILLAGFLLIVPGFITDFLGLMLFIPAVRNLVWSVAGPRIVISGTSFSGYGRRSPSGRTGDDRTIDLDAEDYRRSNNQNSPWRLPGDK